MSGEQQQDSEDRTEAQGDDKEERSEADKAGEAKESHEKAQETMKKLEEQDEPPTELSDWPDDGAKYVTYGGTEGDHSYDEGPEKKLGPSSLERHEDGSISIEGEEVDNPEDYKADPIPGGPTDPNAPELSGEKKKKEKLEKQRDEGSESGDSSTAASNESEGSGDDG